jgi:hypothetical protein
MRTLLTTAVIGLAVMAPAGAAQARAPVTRAEASLAAHRLAQQAATELEGQSATGIEILSKGAARVDRSRTSVGNFLRYSRFRMGASFALFGTNTVHGVMRTLWCVGNLEVARDRSGRTRSAGTLTCPIS